MPVNDVSRVTDDEKDFYGKRYWIEHQSEDLGRETIFDRANKDLIERCPFWLRTLLRFKPPPSRVLEIGSAHGGFTALLRWAGYEATGLEISPWIVEFSRKIFDIPVLLGPVEASKELRPRSLDAVILMDVLEHLPDPLGTMRCCMDLMAPGGVLLLQTPCYPEGKSFEVLQKEGHRFLEMLQEREHLYLFSERSVRELLLRAGFGHLEFTPALFSHYDMFLVAGGEPFSPVAEGAGFEALSTPSGRIVRALVDLEKEKRDLVTRYQESENDRSARLEIIQRQSDIFSRLKTQPWTLLPRLYQKVKWRTTRRMRLLLVRLTRSSRWISKRGTRVGGSVTAIPTLAPEKMTVAVDLTPILPGGENGGAKIMVLELLKGMARVAPNVEFLLLTTAQNHDELGALETPTMRRWLVRPDLPKTTSRIPFVQRWGVVLGNYLRTRISPATLHQLKALYRAWMNRRHSFSGSQMLSDRGVDVLFCPFTAPYFYDPTIPLVSVIYDLQYADYPQFFSPDDLYHRDRTMKETCRAATRLICISNHVRATVLKKRKVNPDHVKTVHISLAGRIPKPDFSIAEKTLSAHGLSSGRFLFYPANYWAHKNHRMLLVAFGIYCKQHPSATLKLVCTGALGKSRDALDEAASVMGLAEKTLFLGYVSDVELAGLLVGCRAMVFPSLYEGFGMPVLEAMSFRKPVLCSNVTSLPEIAGDAVYYFDPRKPTEIVQAIESLEQDPELEQKRLDAGLRQVVLFSDSNKMARDYLAVIREAAVQASYKDGVYGLYPDRWTGERAVITFSDGAGSRTVEMVLSTPPWAQMSEVQTRLLPGSEGEWVKRSISHAQCFKITQLVGESAGCLEMRVGPLFQPKAWGFNADERHLGVMFHECRLVSPEGVVDLLEGV